MMDILSTTMDFILNNKAVFIPFAVILIEAGAGYIPDRYFKYIGVIRRIINLILKNKKTAPVLLLPLFLISCASMQPSQICETDQPSVICKELQQPEHTDILLQLANVRMLKNDVYSGQQALEFLDFCTEIVNGSSTYLDLTQYVSRIAQEYQLEVIVLSTYINNLSVDLPITEYDRNLLLAHIAHQKKMVKMYME